VKFHWLSVKIYWISVKKILDIRVNLLKTGNFSSWNGPNFTEIKDFGRMFPVRTSQIFYLHDSPMTISELLYRHLSVGMGYVTDSVWSEMWSFSSRNRADRILIITWLFLPNWLDPSERVSDMDFPPLVDSRLALLTMPPFFRLARRASGVFSVEKLTCVGASSVRSSDVSVGISPCEKFAEREIGRRCGRRCKSKERWGSAWSVNGYLAPSRTHHWQKIAIFLLSLTTFSSRRLDKYVQASHFLNGNTKNLAWNCVKFLF